MNRLHRILACIGVSVVLVAGTGVTAAGAAAVSSAYGDAVSTGPPAYWQGHFSCAGSSGSPYIKQNWPNMVSASGGVETVLFGSQLQYWNNTAWVNLSTDAYGVNGWSGWFQGLSNSYGRLDQQLYKSLLPYQTWFLTMTGNVPNDFNGVVWHVWSGYYFRTVEYYSWPAKSTSWYSKPSSEGPYASSVVGSSYCLAP